MESIPYYQQYLQKELASRMRRNSNYSMRSMARSLGVHVSTLSRAISGKPKFGEKLAERLTQQLGLVGEDKRQFINSLPCKKRFQNANLDGQQESCHLDEEIFEAIADLHHFAILELTFVEGFRPDPDWIAPRVGISKFKAKHACDRLQRLGLLVFQNGKWQKSKGRILAGQKTLGTSQALLEHQRQIMQRAMKALDTVPRERRCMTGMTIPADPQKIAMARIILENVAHEVCNVLADGEIKEVYQLGISLFPLQK